MNILEIILLGCGLAMDACTVSMADGISESGMRIGKSVLIAAVFGMFQGLMPIFGYYTGLLFTDRLQNIDNYIAFFILLFLGLKMLFEARNKEEILAGVTFPKILLQGVATSIDALFAGVTLAIAGVKVYLSALIIALVTAVLCFIAVHLGCICGHFIKNKAQILGGIILILLGIKMLF